MSDLLNKIHLQDCIEGLSQIDEGSVHLGFADPPFNIGYEYDQYDDRRAAEEYIDWCRQWLTAVDRVLCPDGTFWLAIGDDFAAELKLLMQNELGLVCRSWVIWYYTFGVNCKNKFSRSHTHLFYMIKSPDAFTFNADDLDIRVPSARQLVYGDKRANPKGRLPDDTWITSPPPCYDLAEPDNQHEGWVLRPQDIPESFTDDDSVWYFPRVCGTFKERAGWHGCQMPERLLGRIIRACSNEGDTVLDPFAGSGTTPAVAKKLGRQYLGYEISENYHERATDRLASIEVGDRLDGEKQPLKSAPSTKKGRRLDAKKKKVRAKESAATQESPEQTDAPAPAPKTVAKKKSVPKKAAKKTTKSAEEKKTPAKKKATKKTTKKKEPAEKKPAKKKAATKKKTVKKKSTETKKTAAKKTKATKKKAATKKTTVKKATKKKAVAKKKAATPKKKVTKKKTVAKKATPKKKTTEKKKAAKKTSPEKKTPAKKKVVKKKTVSKTKDLPPEDMGMLF